MLGRKDEPRSPSPNPTRRTRHGGATPVPPLSIPVHPMMQPSLTSSASSSYSSVDYLATPVEWTGGFSHAWSEDEEYPRAYEPPPQFAVPAAPIAWTYGYVPQTTTITMKPVRPPTSQPRPRRERERPGQLDPASQPLPMSPDPEVDNVSSSFGALQISTQPVSSGYSSDEDTPTRPSSASIERDPSPAAPFRRSSLGAVVELDGKRTASRATAREPHATHRRGRPSM